MLPSCLRASDPSLSLFAPRTDESLSFPPAFPSLQLAALFCLVLALLVTPVLADAGAVINVLGDLLAVFVGIAIVFICVCALIGYFARPRA